MRCVRPRREPADRAFVVAEQGHHELTVIGQRSGSAAHRRRAGPAGPLAGCGRRRGRACMSGRGHWSRTGDVSGGGSLSLGHAQPNQARGQCIHQPNAGVSRRRNTWGRSWVRRNSSRTFTTRPGRQLSEYIDFSITAVSSGVRVATSPPYGPRMLRPPCRWPPCRRSVATR